MTDLFTDTPPEEDSEDLTNAEILAAVLTGQVSDLVIHLTEQTCPECRSRLLVAGHALRRRAPNLYWRVSARCANGHPTQVTYQTNWLKR